MTSWTINSSTNSSYPPSLTSRSHFFVSSATLTMVPFVLHACRSLHSIFSYAVARVWLIATAFRLPVALLFAATACGILCRAVLVVCHSRCNAQLGVVLLSSKGIDFWLWHIQLQQHGHCFPSSFCSCSSFSTCAAYIKVIQGQFTFVYFKEVAFKIPVIEGTNDMVFLSAASSHRSQWAVSTHVCWTSSSSI